MPDLITVFGMLALILMVAALTSGLVERAPLSFPMIFLGLGFLMGERGLGLVKISLHDPSLETIGTLSLAFVLFLDAINLRFDHIRNDWIIPALSLGPGTLLTILLTSLSAVLLLGMPALQALLLGTVLASVDPVLLRDVVRDNRIPHSIRESLRTEAGANDMIVLPVLLVLAAIAGGHAESAAGWAGLLARLLLLGPLAGAVIGATATLVMKQARKRFDIHREYRALYGIGILLAAYFIGARLGGSGFLAVFTAGLAVAIFDKDLCDCFLEYGEITSEMMMLLAFLLFGAVLSTLITSVPLLPVILFTAAVLVAARPIAINLVLLRARISRQARLFIGWFGPRGLSSLLFGLLLVSSGVPGAEQILAVAGVVVIISVILHGASAAPLARRYQRVVAHETLPEERESTLAGLYAQNPLLDQRVTPQVLADQLNSSNPPILLDVRSRSSYDRDDGQIPGSVRVLPDEVMEWAAGQPRERDIVTYCT